MDRVAEKLHGVISRLTDEYNGYDIRKRIRKSELQNLVHDLEVVDAELHDLKMPPITEDIQSDNKVCIIYVINKLNQILTKSESSVSSEVAEFYNELVYNLGVNTLRNHNNPKGDNNG